MERGFYTHMLQDLVVSDATRKHTGDSPDNPDNLENKSEKLSVSAPESQNTWDLGH